MPVQHFVQKDRLDSASLQEQVTQSQCAKRGGRRQDPAPVDVEAESLPSGRNLDFAARASEAEQVKEFRERIGVTHSRSFEFFVHGKTPQLTFAPVATRKNRLVHYS